MQRAHADPADGYSATYPMASYAPGETVRIQWPAKNHATVGTQRGVQLFFGKGPGLGDDFSHIISKDAWIAANPGLEQTFSSCQPNQAGVDGAECLGDFVVPNNLQQGIYSVIWWWEFNAGEFYSSCYDVLITEDGSDAPDGTGRDDDPCFNLPADTCPYASSIDVGPGGLALVNAPSTIPSASGSSFDVTIKYEASEYLMIVVDVLDGQDKFAGGGMHLAREVAAGSGELTYTVEIADCAPSDTECVDLSPGQEGVYLKVWNVRVSQWEDGIAANAPWENEITRVDRNVDVGDSVVTCTPIPDDCLEALGLATGVTGTDGGALAGAIVCFMVVLVLVFVCTSYPSLASYVETHTKGLKSVVHAAVRFLECFLSLVAFASWSSSEGLNTCDCDEGGNFLIAMGVLVWLYTLTILLMMLVTCMGVEAITSLWATRTDVIFGVFVPALDIILAVLSFCAVCAAALRHPDTAEAKGAIASLFFVTLPLVLSGVVITSQRFAGKQSSSKFGEKMTSNDKGNAIAVSSPAPPTPDIENVGGNTQA